MPRNNQNVIDCWMRWSMPARTSTLKTNGDTLFSYDLKIGVTRLDKDGKRIKFVFDHTTKSGNFRSHTTSKHVGFAKQAGAILVPPDYQFSPNYTK
jgi:hypothetical protein